MRGLAKAVALAVAIVALQPSATQLSGQSVLVEVTESETGRPIAGAFLSLLDVEGRSLRSALSGPAGRFLFPVAEPGAFRVKAEMIGRGTEISSPVTIRGDESASVSLALAVHAIPLAGIQVEADEQCEMGPEEGPEIARVWDEARKALSVQAWTENEGLYRLNISLYDRNLDPSGRRVEAENRRATISVTRTPFVSLPPEDLMTGGFIRRTDDGGHQYIGPDAPALLSEIFLDTHCFSLRRSRDLPNSLGLAFEPLEGSDLPDIEGTLWLDDTTAELQFLEYRFTRLPYREAEGFASGQVEFEAMPNGAWIIDRWWIRAPLMAQHFDMARAGDRGIRVAGILEAGGEVTGVSTLTDERVYEVQGGSLGGLVWDSTRAAPLEGATVYLSGTQYAVLTDASGRFVIDGLPAGTFTAGFTHPLLDTLGVFPPGREVEIRPGEGVELQLAVPSTETILFESCRAFGQGSGRGALTGRVISQAGGVPVPGAKVRVAWQDVGFADPLIQARNEWTEVWTDSDGRYAACQLPLQDAVFVSATFLEAESEVVKVGLTEVEHRVLDLTLDLPMGLVSTRSEPTAWVEEYGVQGVQGVLREPESGTPVRSGEVALRDGSGRIRVSGVSNDKGFFRLQIPVPGRYVFSAQALGYAEVNDVVVEVTRGYLAVLEIQMAPRALELEPLVVTAEARAFHLEMEGFYDRQTRSATGGIFLNPDFLDRRRPSQLTDVFFGLAGTRVVEPANGIGGRAVYFRSGVRLGAGGIQICWPMIYVDHHLISLGGLSGADPTALDDFLHGAEVSAVEVYRSPAEVPSEFSGANAGCGVIVVWTKRGGGG